MTYRAELIDETTGETVKVGYGDTKEAALDSVGFAYQRGFDAIVTREIASTDSGLSGCGVHSFYVD